MFKLLEFHKIFDKKGKKILTFFLQEFLTCQSIKENICKFATGQINLTQMWPILSNSMEPWTFFVVHFLSWRPEHRWQSSTSFFVDRRKIWSKFTNDIFCAFFHLQKFFFSFRIIKAKFMKNSNIQRFKYFHWIISEGNTAIHKRGMIQIIDFQSNQLIPSGFFFCFFYQTY